MNPYDELAESLVPTINEYGAAVTITATDSANTQTVTTGKVVRWKRVKHTEPNTQIQTGDWVFLASKALTPKKMASFALSGETLTIIDFEPISPGDVVVAWTIWCRGS